MRRGGIMPQQVKVISQAGVNCYLVKSDDGCFLIDTGFSFRRRHIEKEMVTAGCAPGNLKLIVLTHGDFDHTGNADYFRKKYGARIAAHRGESGVVEKGDMMASRQRPRRRPTRLVLAVMRYLVFRAFRPDIYLEDGDDLSGYGLDARIVHIPGHSSGSIGVLTAGGDLFSGDLFDGRGRPVLNSNMDDAAAGRASLEKLRGLEIRNVFPGHGRPFNLPGPMAAAGR
jgi:hydroxyacylglutathione hydrolase